MKISLTLDIPEAKTISECRMLASSLLEAGRQYALLDFQVVNFKFLPELPKKLRGKNETKKL